MIHLETPFSFIDIQFMTKNGISKSISNLRALLKYVPKYLKLFFIPLRTLLLWRIILWKYVRRYSYTVLSWMCPFAYYWYNFGGGIVNGIRRVGQIVMLCHRSPLCPRIRSRSGGWATACVSFYCIMFALIILGLLYWCFRTV